MFIQERTHFIRKFERPPVFFLPDYDISSAKHLAYGVNVWIDTSLTPTLLQGIEVLVNGGLHFSSRHDWLHETLCMNKNRPVFKKNLLYDFEQDATDANLLYECIEEEMIPDFFSRNADGIPDQWIKKIKTSLALAPQFSSDKILTQYREELH